MPTIKGKSNVQKLNRKYRQNLKLVESIIGHQKETTGAELDKLSTAIFGNKYRGLYGATDKLPKLKNRECIIINKPSNTHWLGLAKINGHEYAYDSYNRPNFLGSGYRNGDIDNIADQSGLQENCGQRTVAWLCTILSQ